MTKWYEHFLKKSRRSLTEKKVFHFSKIQKKYKHVIFNLMKNDITEQ